MKEYFQKTGYNAWYTFILMGADKDEQIITDAIKIIVLILMPICYWQLQVMHSSFIPTPKTLFDPISPSTSVIYWHTWIPDEVIV